MADKILLWIVVQLSLSRSEKHPSHLSSTDFEYCIVGAGPGGLQVGQFMHKKGWNYVIFERRTGPGSFFQKFPIHRQLISLNKRFTGRSDPEFNLRHDWNSLLDTDVAPVTNRSKQRFPHASVLVEYLKDFAKEQEDAEKIVYDAEVRKVGQGSRDGLQLDVLVRGSAVLVSCPVVIMASGIGVPNMPHALLQNGWGEATLYSDMPSSYHLTNYEEYSRYEGKRALVVGLGNAALETADALAPYVAFVHLLPGRQGKIRTPLFAHETRYVGDVRLMRANIFDSYLLKSLDGGMNGMAISAESHVLAKCGDQWCVLALDPSKQVVVFYFHSKNSRARRLAGRLEDAGYVAGRMDPIQAKNAAVFVSMPDDEEQQYVKQKWHQQKGKVIRNAHAELHGVYLNRSVLRDSDMVLAISKELASTESPFPMIYDVVVRATGWKLDTGIYGSKTKPIVQPSGKFAALTEEYEAIGVKNLYFAGAQGHAKDHKKAAGGFIHGFRYTARALVRILAAKRGETWPHTKFDLTDGNSKGVGKFVSRFLSRIDSASGPYQMVHVLGDGAVLSCNGTRIEATYYEEMPVEYFNRKFAGRSRFLMVFGYGTQRQVYPSSINGGTLFHAMLWHYPGKCSSVGADERFNNSKQLDGDGFPVVQPKELLAFKESLHTEWDKPLAREQMHDFIKVRAKHAVSGIHLSPFQHGTDLHLREPTLYKVSGRWGRGEVDLLVKNVGKVAVTLLRFPVGYPLGRRVAGKTTEGLDEVAIAELESIILQPDEGRRIFSEESERWEVTKNGKTIERKTVDCAYGVVQDWIVGEKKLAQADQCSREGKQCDKNIRSKSKQ